MSKAKYDTTRPEVIISISGRAVAQRIFEMRIYPGGRCRSLGRTFIVLYLGRQSTKTI